MTLPECSNGGRPPLQPPFNPDVAMSRATSSKTGVRKDSGFGERPKGLLQDSPQTDNDAITTTTPTNPVESVTNLGETSQLYHCHLVQGHPDAYTLQSSSSLPDTTCSRRSSTSSRALDGSTRSYRSRSSSKRSPNSLRRFATNDLTPPGARPHRMRSNPTIPLPYVNIEEAIALHQRSCALFRVPTGSSLTTTSPISVPPLQRSYTITCVPPSSHIHTLEHELSAPTLREHFTQSEDEDGENETYYEPYPATITHWTSNHTRRREYAEIDRRSKGLRGLLRKMIPGWCHRSNSRTEFYNEQSNKREGSVRRYRMDLPPEEDGDDGQGHVVNEKIAVIGRGSEEVAEISLSEGSTRS